MIGDSHAMSVAAQILEHVCGATEWGFCVDYPVFSEEQSQPGCESFRLGEGSQISMEAQVAALEGLLQTNDELTAKNSRQHLEGKKEPVL